MTQYLYHHGIKGMRWGIRRFQNPDGSLTAEGKKRYASVDKWTYEGSDRTKKYTERLLSADKKYGRGRTVGQQMKINKLASKADKSFKRDIEEARSVGNTAAANRLRSGRTYLKTLTDGNYLNAAITDAAIQAKVTAGENFTYNILRNEEVGGITITVNGQSFDYVYDNPR